MSKPIPKKPESTLKKIEVDFFEKENGYPMIPTRNFEGTHEEVVEFIKDMVDESAPHINGKGYNTIGLEVWLGEPQITHIPQNGKPRSGCVEKAGQKNDWLIRRYVDDEEILSIRFFGSELSANMYLEGWISEPDPIPINYRQRDYYLFEMIVSRDVMDPATPGRVGVEDD